MTVAVDLEAFWSRDYSVQQLGPWAYAADPRFDCYQVALHGQDRDGRLIEWVGELAALHSDGAARV